MVQSFAKNACLVLAVLTCLGAMPASAQVLATLSWQTQPYCNVLTLTLNSTPAGFTLDGTDDQCGATNKASAVGLATFNAGGNVTLNLTIVMASSGKAVHLSAVVSPANGNGTWTDSVGNTGTFALGGAVPGLPARPFPASGLGASTVTATELAPGAVGASQLAPNAVSGANVADGSLTSADLRDGPRASLSESTQVRLIDATEPVVLRSVTLIIPASGHVIANAAVTTTVQSAEVDRGVCSLTTGTALDTVNQVGFGELSTGPALIFPVSLTRGFEVSAGTFVLNLVCQMTGGAAGTYYPSLTTMYFPR